MPSKDNLYTVRLTIDYVVVADSEKEADEVAREMSTQALGDLSRYDLDIDVLPGVMADGWDDDCIPYGGDGNTRTGEYK